MTSRTPSPRRARAALLALALAAVGLLSACGGGSPASPGRDVTVEVDGRSFRVHEPANVASGSPTALVVGLHGYTSNASELDSYFALTKASDERGFVLALPEGLTNPQDEQYWNAVDGGCCDFSSAGTDDSTWLSHVVTQLTDTYAIDRVALVGHSNGGYMAQRFACDHADQVDAIASLAGPLPEDTALCTPSRPVTVLHVHGDADDTVPYDGGYKSASAPDTAATWARLDGCTQGPTDGTALDLDLGLDGDETTVRTWGGCSDGTQVQLWTIRGGQHVPTLTPQFTTDLLDVVLG